MYIETTKENEMKTYIAEAYNEKINDYFELQFKAHDLKDADQYASRRIKRMEGYELSNVVEVKNEK